MAALFGVQAAALATLLVFAADAGQHAAWQAQIDRVERVVLRTDSWSTQIAGFAVRLEDGFGLADEHASQYSQWILEAARQQNLPPELVASVIHTESGFRVGARSRFGAVGPAQVRPRFWQGFCGNRDLRDPQVNVECGARILAAYAERCGGVECALESYNVGPRKARMASTRGARKRYVDKVDASLERLGTSREKLVL